MSSYDPPKVTGSILKDAQARLLKDAPKSSKHLCKEAEKLRRDRLRREWFDSKGAEAFGKVK